MPFTGTLDGDDLVLRRALAAPLELIWRHLTRAELLATWFGTVTGDPARGTVDVTMTAEPGEAAAAPFRIHRCEAPRLLSVSSAMGEDTWRLTLEVVPAAAATALTLRHHDVPAEMVEHVGPGWEWYLDRLTGAVTGDRIPGMDVWDGQYMTLAPQYAALRDRAPGGGPAASDTMTG